MEIINSTGIKTLSSLLKDSKYSVALTGAGMSTESGIPDFRSKDGWWQKINPTQVASIDSLNNSYEVFREFYQHRISTLKECRPNIGHEILADLEKIGLLRAVVTQNIDSFHSEAGSKNVFELHGAISHIVCFSCNTKSNVESFMNNSSCDNCGGRLRPGVVLFGEGLPQDTWGGANAEIQQSDLLLVIGTSLNVSPVNSLPFVSKGKKILINMDSTPFDDKFDLIINGKAGQVLSTVKI